MRKSPLFYGLLLGLLITSCHREPEKKVLTERIQYDVTIKNPDADQDWWVQNMEGSKREAFIKMILDEAYSGKIKAYDAFNNPLTVEQVKAIGNRTDTVLGPSPKPPYDDTLMVVKQQLQLRDITKVRFLEEWYIDEGTFKMEKKVVGIAPMILKYSETGELQGSMLLFWLYLDKKYPLKQ